MYKVLHFMRKKWSLSHQELRPIISNFKYNYQSEKGNKNLLHMQFRQQSMKVSKSKQTSEKNFVKVSKEN